MLMPPITAITGLLFGDSAAAEGSAESLGSTRGLNTESRPSTEDPTLPDFAGVMLQALAAPPPQAPKGPLIGLAQPTSLVSSDGEHEASVADGAVRDPGAFDTAPPRSDHARSTPVEIALAVEPGPGEQITPNRPVEHPGAQAAPTRPADRSPGPQTVPQVTRADREIENLDPKLARGIRRVAERMLAERGNEVELVEGYRSIARQQFLFAQGRTAPGPVVTWTRQSLHSQGRAADLQIDGTWENAAAYGALQRIAEEEGLATLGMRDPGHIQLTESRGLPSFRADARAGVIVARQGGSTTGGAAIGIAARVADVAVLARVAQVAVVAPPGVSIDVRRADSTSTDSQPSDGTTRPMLPSPESLPTPESPKLPGTPRVITDGARARTAADRGDLEESDATLIAKTTSDGAKRKTTQDRQTPKAGRSLDATPPLASQTPRLATPTDPIRGAAATTPVDVPQGAERVATVQNLQDLAAAAPGRLHVSLEGPDGAGTRINLTLRGSAVDASIQLDDPATARHLNSRIAELHTALRKRGFEPASLRVQQLPPRANVVELSGAPRSTAADAPFPTSEGGASSQRHPNEHSKETLRDAREEPRRFQQHPQRNPESEAKP